MHDDLTAATEWQHDPAIVTLAVGRGILRRIASVNRTGDDHHLDSVLAGIPDRDLQAALDAATTGACSDDGAICRLVIASELRSRVARAAVMQPVASLPDDTLTACTEAFHTACQAAHIPGGDEGDIDEEIREGITAALAAHVVLLDRDDDARAHVLDELLTASRNAHRTLGQAIDHADRTGLAA